MLPDMSTAMPGISSEEPLLTIVVFELAHLKRTQTAPRPVSLKKMSPYWSTATAVGVDSPESSTIGIVAPFLSTLSVFVPHSVEYMFPHESTATPAGPAKPINSVTGVVEPPGSMFNVPSKRSTQ
jgi:hypothetical protein